MRRKPEILSVSVSSNMFNFSSSFIGVSHRASKTDPINRASKTDPINRASKTDPIDRASKTDPINRASKTDPIDRASQTDPIKRRTDRKRNVLYRKQIIENKYIS